MTFSKDENGRYWIPAKPGEARVEMDCDCGYGMNCPERVWDHISGQHAAAHQKGRDGLPAAASWDIRQIAADQPSAGPSQQVPEPGSYHQPKRTEPSPDGKEASAPASLNRSADLDAALAKARAAMAEIDDRRAAQAAERDREHERSDHEHVKSIERGDLGREVVS